MTDDEVFSAVQELAMEGKLVTFADLGRVLGTDDEAEMTAALERLVEAGRLFRVPMREHVDDPLTLHYSIMER